MIIPLDQIRFVKRETRRYVYVCLGKQGDFLEVFTIFDKAQTYWKLRLKENDVRGTIKSRRRDGVTFWLIKTTQVVGEIVKTELK